MTANHGDTPATDRQRLPLPAYGPIEALLGVALFYVFLDRATPTIVDVLTTAVAGISPAAVRTALAVALWFVLVVAILNQARRQYEAIGGASERDVPSLERLIAYLVLAVIGGAVAGWTLERAIVAGITFVRAAGTVDVSLIGVVDVAVTIVFFVTWGVAVWAFDRLLVGWLRRVIAAGP